MEVRIRKNIEKEAMWKTRMQNYAQSGLSVPVKITPSSQKNKAMHIFRM